MTTAGIIAEYNPFHKGHEYQICQLRKLYQADCIVIAMSGNFVQRGTPALLDKYTRTRMALSCGADLVLEIPTLYATGSAEYFAAAGVKLLAASGVCDLLGFGTEAESIIPLQKLAAYLQAPDPAFREHLAALLKSGISYPAAREAALTSAFAASMTAEEIHALVSQPNNILALEYLKALTDTDMMPAPVRRLGASYHSRDIAEELASATAIRRLLHTSDGQAETFGLLPSPVFRLLQETSSRDLLFEEDLDPILAFRLLQIAGNLPAEDFADCPSDLLAHIRKHAREYTGYDSFLDCLHSRNYTDARIRRALLHILLDLHQSEYDAIRSSSIPYIRVLGFRKESSSLLSRMAEKASAPVVMKKSDCSQLSEEALLLLQQDSYASELYSLLRKTKGGSPLPYEFSAKMIVL